MEPQMDKNIHMDDLVDEFTQKSQRRYVLN